MSDVHYQNCPTCGCEHAVIVSTVYGEPDPHITTVWKCGHSHTYRPAHRQRIGGGQ